MPKSKLSRPWRVIWWIELLFGMPTPEFYLETSHRFVESYSANLAWVTTTSIIELKCSKSNLCRSKGHQCYFLFYFCHFFFGWSAKVFGKIRKSSLIFGGPRVSLCVIGLTADHYFWCSRVFLAVLTVFRGIMGCSGVLWDVSGVFRGCSGLFRAVPGCSGAVPGMFRGVPGVVRGFPGCSGAVPRLFRVLQTPVSLTILTCFLQEYFKTCMEIIIYSIFLTIYMLFTCLFFTYSVNFQLFQWTAEVLYARSLETLHL